MIVDVPRPDSANALIGEIDYEALLAEGDPAYAWRGPQDEWQSLCLLYTSGTTGDPAAYQPSWRLSSGARQCPHLRAKLRRLPLDPADVPDHCAAGPTLGHSCGRRQAGRRARSNRRRSSASSPSTRSRTCAPRPSLTMIVNAPPTRPPLDHTVKCATGGAGPSSTVLRDMEATGFEVITYGATETYAPAPPAVSSPPGTICRPSSVTPTWRARASPCRPSRLLWWATPRR